jgi:diketogulonate reductase-like aldo/keto reductase
MLRWQLQQGRSAIPKSVKPARMPEPDSITLESYGVTIPEA